VQGDIRRVLPSPPLGMGQNIYWLVSGELDKRH
jgi:hypothetical protein